MKFNLKISFIFILICLIVIFFYNLAEASEIKSLDIYDSETIYIHYSFWGNGFVKDGRIMRLGAFGSNLAKEMSGSKFAMEEMQKARKYGITSSIANVVATGFGITGIVMIIMNKDDSRKFDIASIIIGGVCNIVAEAFNRSSMAAMNRAVWLYNREVTTTRFPLSRE